MNNLQNTLKHLTFDFTKGEPLFSLFTEEKKKNFLTRYENFKKTIDTIPWVSELKRLTHPSSPLLRDMHEHKEKMLQYYDGIMLFGIGGSYLGAKSVRNALSKKSPQIYWVSNIDPIELQKAKAWLSTKQRPGFVVITKSGTTIETIASFFYLYPFFAPHASHSVAITDPDKGSIKELAKKHGWKTLDIPPSVGGRFSVFTPGALFPLLLDDVEIAEFCHGALQTIDDIINKKDPFHSPIFLLSSLALLAMEDHKNIHVMMPYIQTLKSFGDWFSQLMAESLGKNGMGFTPLAALGSSDQHSLLQLFQEGPKDKLIGFLHVDSYGDNEMEKIAPPKSLLIEEDKKNYPFIGADFKTITDAALLSTQKSLYDVHLPSYTIKLNQLSEEPLGGLYSFFLLSCLAIADFMEIDPYGQPGVEASKTILRKLLTQQ